MSNVEGMAAMGAPVVEEEGDGWEWAVVEVMGHRRHVGRCREVERFGAKMLRVDIPVAGEVANGWQTHFYAGSALFSYTVTDEASALKANKPVQSPAVYRIGYQSPVDDLYGSDDHYDEEDSVERARAESSGLRVVQALREYFPERFLASEEITPERIAALRGDLDLARQQGVLFRPDEAQAPYEVGPGQSTYDEPVRRDG